MQQPVIPIINPPVLPSFLKFPFLSNIPFLQIIYFLFLVGYIIVSVALMYHWSRYGMKSPGVLVAETLFLAVSIALFIVANLTMSYF